MAAGPWSRWSLACIVKKPWEMNSSAYAFSLSVGDLRLWNSVTHILGDTQCSVKPFWKPPHRHLRGVFMALLNSVRLTVKINHLTMEDRFLLLFCYEVCWLHLQLHFVHKCKFLSGVLPYLASLKCPALTCTPQPAFPSSQIRYAWPFPHCAPCPHFVISYVNILVISFLAK